MEDGRTTMEDRRWKIEQREGPANSAGPSRFLVKRLIVFDLPSSPYSIVVVLRRRPPLCILQGLPAVVDLRRLLERLEEEANPLLAKRPCELVALRRPLGDPLPRVGSGPLVDAEHEHAGVRLDRRAHGAQGQSGPEWRTERLAEHAQLRHLCA